MITLSELQIAKAGEHLVCADLILKGYNAFLTDQGLPYDVVVEHENSLFRIQVKTTQNPKPIPQRNDFFPAYIFEIRKRGLGGKRRGYLKSDVDFLAFICLSDKAIGYLPVSKIKQKMNFKLKNHEYSSNSKPGIILENCNIENVLLKSEGEHGSRVFDNKRNGRYIFSARKYDS